MPAFGKVGRVQTTVEIPPEVIITALAAITDKRKEDLEDLEPEQVNEILKGVDPDQLNEALNDHIDLEQLKKEAINKALQEQPTPGMTSFYGSFAVSGDTYYVEYQQRLFRWKPGMTEWFDTGLKDEAELPNLSNLYSGEYVASTNLIHSLGVKLAVSGKTVYVGKRDGYLFQSSDEGDIWNDVTLKLPFASVDFNAIVFAGSTVYVATNKGVAYSEDGTTWQAVTTDAEGGQLVMNRLVVKGTTVYGIAGQHVYRIKENSDVWEQVTPEIPDIVFSLAIDGDTLYVGTAGRGVLRFTLDE